MRRRPAPERLPDGAHGADDLLGHRSGVAAAWIGPRRGRARPVRGDRSPRRAAAGASGGIWAAEGTIEDHFVQFTEGVVAQEELSPPQRAPRAACASSFCARRRRRPACSSSAAPTSCCTSSSCPMFAERPGPRPARGCRSSARCASSTPPTRADGRSATHTGMGLRSGSRRSSLSDPSSAINDGTSSARMIDASIRTASAAPASA